MRRNRKKITQDEIQIAGDSRYARKILETPQEPDRKKTSLYLDVNVMEDVKKICKEHDLSVSLVLERLLRDFIEKVGS